MKLLKILPPLMLLLTHLLLMQPMVALLETHQREDGRVHIPEALRPYFGADLL